jgi:hypothetical protein
MRIFAAILVLLSLLGCGGGGGGGGSSGSAATASSPGGSAVTLTGLAAQGAAISGRIYLMDAAGQERYVDTRDGQFSVTLSGMQPPMLLKAQWSDASGMHRLYSFASANGIANITPLTHFAVAAASGTRSADALYAAPSRAAFMALQAALPAAVTRLQGYLQPLMRQYAVAQVHPITAVFSVNDSGMDALLDRIQLATLGDSVTLSDRSTGATLLAAPLANPSLGVGSANWSPTDAALAADMAVAVNPQGLGLLAWSQHINGTYQLRVRWLDGRDSGQALSSAGDAGAPRLAFDSAGNALALWAQHSGGRTSIWASRYHAGAGQWAPARQLSSGLAGSAHLPDLAVDAAGNAVAVWHQDDGRPTHFDGWLAHYAAASDAWAGAQRFTDGASSAFGVRVALNPAGTGVLAWQQLRGDGSAGFSQPVDIALRSLSTAGAWGALRLANADSAGLAYAAYVHGQLGLSVNAGGSAALVWSQRLLPHLPMAVAAALYQPGSGWQAASTITRDLNEDSHSPQVALDATGNALVVWQQQTDYGAYGGTNRYVAGSGWGTAGFFVDSRLGDAFAPSLAMDAQGNASVAWFRWSSGNQVDVMLNRYLADRGWAQAQVFAPLGSHNAMGALPPRVAVNASGQALLLWGFDTDAVASWL